MEIKSLIDTVKNDGELGPLISDHAFSISYKDEDDDIRVKEDGDLKEYLEYTKNNTIPLLIEIIKKNENESLENEKEKTEDVMDCTEESEEDEFYIILLGNPGVGKSTILNSLIQKIEFPSGFSIGKGMTSENKMHLNEGIHYVDTPGLSDVEMRKLAAEEITKGLSKNAFYKLVFVTTIEAGRVRPDDVATFNLILESIDLPRVSYGVIVNKVTKRTYENVNNNEEDFKSIFNSLNTGKFKTPHFIFNQRLDELDDEDNVLHKFEEIEEFVEGLPFEFIPKEKVKKIEIDLYESKKTEYENIMSKMKNDIKTKEEFYLHSIDQLKKQQQELEMAEKEKIMEFERKKEEMIKKEERIKQVEAERLRLLQKKQEMELKQVNEMCEEKRRNNQTDNLKLIEELRRVHEEKLVLEREKFVLEKENIRRNREYQLLQNKFAEKKKKPFSKIKSFLKDLFFGTSTSQNSTNSGYEQDYSHQN